MKKFIAKTLWQKSRVVRLVSSTSFLQIKINQYFLKKITQNSRSLRPLFFQDKFIKFQLKIYLKLWQKPNPNLLKIKVQEFIQNRRGSKKAVKCSSMWAQDSLLIILQMTLNKRFSLGNFSKTNRGHRGAFHQYLGTRASYRQEWTRRCMDILNRLKRVS